MLGSPLRRGVPRKAGRSREQVVVPRRNRDRLHGKNGVVTFAVTRTRQLTSGAQSVGIASAQGALECSSMAARPNCWVVS